MSRPVSILAAPLYLGVDIGGTKIAIAVVTGSGIVLASERWPTRSGSAAAEAIAHLQERVQAFCTAYSSIIAIGVGICAQIDPSTGAISSADTAIPGWRLYPLRDLLENLTHRPVAIDNDARAALLGELWTGAAIGATDALLLSIGTGVGAGIITSGCLVRGAHGGAGEAGHIGILPSGPLCDCGNRGCLETLVSGPALTLAAQRLGFPSPQALFAAAPLDWRARREVHRRGNYLSRALLTLVNLFQPAIVILAGGVMGSAAPWWLPQIRRAIQRHTFPSNRSVTILTATHHEQAGAIGAAALARHRHGQS